MNLEQAQFEIEALQRRLAEYAGEVQRLRAQNATLTETLNTRVNREVEHLNELEMENQRLRNQVAQLLSACELVLMFHSGSPWDFEKQKKWANRLSDILGPSDLRNPYIVGDNGDGTWDGARPTNEATTKNLCNAVRAALSTRVLAVVDRDKARVIAEALQSSQSELLFSPRPIIKDEQQRQFIVNKSQVAIAMARELGLLKDE